MTDDIPNGLTVTVSGTVIDLTLVYPDGSQLQLTMPKPPGIEAQTREQIETMARRMARRLLGVALEDLGGGVGPRNFRSRRGSLLARLSFIA